MQTDTDKRAPILQLDSLCFRYSAEDRNVFENISYDFRKGGFYLVQGPSGTGKSTLLRLISRLEEPYQGEIRFKGAALASYNPPLLRSRILYVQQVPAIIRGTVKENLLLPFRFHANQDKKQPQDADLQEKLQAFSLNNVDLEQPAENLSVGQQQRLCLIRGMLLKPEVILLDEPTSALDGQSAAIVENQAETICRDQQVTVIMVSHRPYHPATVTPVKITICDSRLLEKK